MQQFKTLIFMHLVGLSLESSLVPYIFQWTNVIMNCSSKCMSLRVEVTLVLPLSGFRNLVGKHEVGFLGGGIDPAPFHYRHRAIQTHKETDVSLVRVGIKTRNHFSNVGNFTHVR
jgi:hypothetical protein